MKKLASPYQFHPTLLGTLFLWEDNESPAMITDQTEDEIYIESEYYTGWWDTAFFRERLGVDV